ncbi:MAG: protein of unknown function DUF1330 [uncultured Blastococcus sp.]|uniref:DUF1330 domain-containing protein n=1 Tax=uncultured Blastococcus sp. TaxID=217144 RepID=A0A6J4I3J6_9ACTN|nr:MAG: protein of unknown function DUF1330 [uncultured Blastococcus sp.]
MSAYVVMIRRTVTDETEIAAYRAEAPLAREGHDVTPIVAYGALDVLEGADLDGVAINRFPSMAAAREWYDSDRYRHAMAHRHRGADYQVILVEGVDRP